ncbi:MAG: FtsX-like permease family protein, partial [Chloroflexi bacterium]|nr:FtsX-like permease family protein [Chloroflexota bacterium]
MKPFKVLQIAWRGLTKNKLRSLLTMLGVIIGVSAVIIMVSISAGTEATISEQINGLGANLLFISQSGGFGGVGGGNSNTQFLSYEDMLALEEDVKGVVGVSTERNSFQTIKFNNIILDEIEIVGTTTDFPSVREVPVDEGRFFTQQEIDRKTKVIVLGYGLAIELFGESDPIGQTITVGTTKMAIIGVMEEKGSVSGVDYDYRLYMPITVVFQKFTPSQFARIIGDRVNVIYAQVNPELEIEDVIFQVQLFLSKEKDVALEELPYVVQTQQDIISTQEATTAAFRSLLAWVAAVSLLVGGIGIMNIMLVSVTERTREIGIRQSVGATPNDIRWQFLTEALVLSLVGGTIGIIVGIGGGGVFG